MCDWCGCDKIRTVAELTEEHDQVISLIGDVLKAISSNEIDVVAEVVRHMIDILAPHTEVEEDGLFPAMAEHFPGNVARLVDEHRHIETVLNEALNGTPSDPSWPKRLSDILTLLRLHIIREENDLFPSAQQFLDPEQWVVIEEIRHRQLHSRGVVHVHSHTGHRH